MGGCQSSGLEQKAKAKANAVTPDKPPSSSNNSSGKYNTEDTAALTIPKVSPENNYCGFKENLNLLCLDQFVSRYTGELMHRWRPATIVYMERDTGQVKVHYDGGMMTDIVNDD
jgi:hypothetical protein